MGTRAKEKNKGYRRRSRSGIRYVGGTETGTGWGIGCRTREKIRSGVLWSKAKRHDDRAKNREGRRSERRGKSAVGGWREG